MRKIENSDNWYAGYKRDVQVAQTEIALTFGLNPNETLCDIYSLPSHNHQTFFCKLVSENGFAKLIYAKAVQNSIWFSEPIYMYRFEEAKCFSDHPIRNGRIFCGKKIIQHSKAERLISLLSSLSCEQPNDLVNPTIDSELTAIRVYEGEKIVREILYTDAEKLAFCECTEQEREKYIEYFRDLHLYIEKIIGLGIG
ncbi:MAG: hypothetical protein K2J80_02495 [Oscillospiraceae bacterium]|nr:hypothetical protein [Oscillospiraceae bacterium]